MINKIGKAALILGGTYIVYMAGLIRGVAETVVHYEIRK